MFSISVYLQGLAAVVLAALCTWIVSVYRKNVAIVDSLWSLMFVLTAGVYTAAAAAPLSRRGLLVLVLVTIWALRLSIYITWRNWGHGEDPRYQAIRARNQPNFAFKSLYLVFLLQALLAWAISLPLLGSVLSQSDLGPLDIAGALLWLVGIVFEAGGDWQLARFSADAANKGRVMDRGFQVARLPRGKSVTAASAGKSRKVRIGKFDALPKRRQTDALRLKRDQAEGRIVEDHHLDRQFVMHRR